MQNKKKIVLNGKTILITGAAGFIGASLTCHLLKNCKDSTIIGIDNLNEYYNPQLKNYRLHIINNQAKQSNSFYSFKKADIADFEELSKIFNEFQPSVVVNLAAQAGVRYSIENPNEYIKSNLIGFYNLLEMARHSYDRNQNGIQHFIFASSSSVYGGNTKVPFSENDPVENPVSLYAATKKSDELLAHSYAKLYNIPSTGLRFFTVYGPAGRPDMAYFSFTEKLRAKDKIKIFNYGKCKRDFTYIDDIVEGLIHVIQGAPKKQIGPDGLPIPPYSLYNIGNSKPEDLMKFVYILSEELISAKVLPSSFDIKEHIVLVPMQPGDVPVTYADIAKLDRDYGYKPSTDLRSGIKKFVEWYKQYYKL